jgi:hypothetical protein
MEKDGKKIVQVYKGGNLVWDENWVTETGVDEITFNGDVYRKVVRINDNEITVDGVVYQRVTKPNQIYLCGLWWDTENLTDEYCNFYEANGRAAVAGKRLPTKEEFKKLSELPRIWDYDGLWFAEDKKDLKNPNKSLFLPAVGYRYLDGTVHYKDSGGYYWSSTPFDTLYGYNLRFFNGYVGLSNDINCNYSFAVRCVRK